MRVIAFPDPAWYIAALHSARTGMKTRIMFCIIMLLVPLLSEAQPYWQGCYVGTSGEINGIAVSSKGSIFATVYMKGLYKSYDSGNSWKRDTLYPFTVMPAVHDVISINNILFLGEADVYNIYKSTDDGLSWRDVGSQTDWNIKFAYDGKARLYSSTAHQGIYQSTDYGETWNRIGLDTIGRIEHLAISTDGDIFASEGQKLYRTTNLGVTWDDLSAKMPGYKIRCISTDTNGGIYVGAFHPGVPPNIFPDGVILISKDRGETWSFHRNQNWDLKVNDIGVTSIGDIIAVTEETLIIRSTDDGATWEGFYDGFIHGGGSCITVTPTGRVFVGASGTVYELMNYPTSSVPPSQASSFALHAAYPNPVAPGGNASIGFALPTEEYVTLTLYNSTGQQVATAAQGRYHPGEHIVTLRTAGLPAGMYLCRITAGRYQSSKAVQVR